MSKFNNDSEYRIQRRTVVFFVWILTVTALSWSFLQAFIKASLQSGYSSQSVLVPFLSAYLVWSERKTIFDRPTFSLYFGIPVVLIGFLVLVVAVLANPATLLAFGAIKMLGLFLVVAGGFTALYGIESLKAAAFPFGLLLLMLPLPGSWIDGIIGFLQFQSTWLSYHLFSMLGVPVYREGFILHVPGVSIEVARECSGINSSVALLITALLVARQTLRTTWRRVALLLITVPLSIVKNAVRIVTLTLLAIYVDPSFLTGHLHHDGGFVFFLIALALVYPIWSFLKKSEDRKTADHLQKPTPRQELSQVSSS